MDIIVVIILIAAAFGAAFTGYFFGKKSGETEIKTLTNEKEYLKTRNEELVTVVNNLKYETATSKTRLDMIGELQKIIKEDFTTIADKIIKEEQSDLRKQNKEALEEKLKPVAEKLDEFKKQVENFNVQGVANTTEIKTQIETLVKENKSIKNTAEDLSNAMKTNSQARGVFGEIILENLLKNSGLINKKDDPEKGNYITQTGFKDTTGGSSNSRPDAVVFFPDNKNVIIDSKCPLNHFMDFANCNEEDERKTHLKQFSNAVTAMIDDLSGKYNMLEGLNTPEFKLMFIPIESCAAYVYSDKAITEKALRQNIIIVCPSSLLATLKVINRAWIQKSQSENLHEILKTALAAYDKLRLFTERAENIRTRFKQTEEAFNELFTTTCGSGGLIKQIESLKKLGIAPAKQIDEKYLKDSDSVATLSPAEISADIPKDKTVKSKNK